MVPVLVGWATVALRPTTTMTCSVRARLPRRRRSLPPNRSQVECPERPCENDASPRHPSSKARTFPRELQKPAGVCSFRVVSQYWSPVGKIGTDQEDIRQCPTGEKPHRADANQYTTAAARVWLRLRSAGRLVGICGHIRFSIHGFSEAPTRIYNAASHSGDSQCSLRNEQSLRNPPTLLKRLFLTPFCLSFCPFLPPARVV